MRTFITGAVAAMVAIASLATPASASTYSGNDLVAAWRGETNCSGQYTEHVVRLVNDSPRPKLFRVRTRSLDGLRLYRVTVPRTSETRISVWLMDDQRGRVLVTYRREVLLHRAGLRPVCTFF